jgi:hypothetical protein
MWSTYYWDAVSFDLPIGKNGIFSYPGLCAHALMGRRARFEPAQREWITDQLHRNQEAVRSREVWNALYAAFLEQFPNASDVRGESITLSRFKNHVRHREGREEGQLVKRALAHLRRHELHEQEHEALAQTRKMASTDEDADFEVRVVKTEPVDQEGGEAAVDATNNELAVAPRPPAPLLRTRATASAIRAEQDQHADPAQSSATVGAPLTTKRPRGRPKKKVTNLSKPVRSVAASSIDAAAVSDVPRKRPRLELNVSVTPRTEGAESVVGKGDEAAEWKAKYEAEKATSESLQARLSEALALLKGQDKQLLCQESTGTPSSSSANGLGASAITFTVSVNVDVSQNGQRLRTTTHALQVDADVPGPA